MRSPCECRERHVRRRIVLTGGPGAGKTAVLELLRHSLCEHVAVLPEAAGIVFGGGFPRSAVPAVRRAAQQAIYHVQLGLETDAESRSMGIVLCDRGVVDGSAYWPAPGDFWHAVGSNDADALRRYDAVIHLRVPDEANGYGHQNPLRVETAQQARTIDDRILHAWENHPRQHVIEANADFMTKAQQALAILQAELPACCRDHTTHALAAATRSGHVRSA